MEKKIKQIISQVGDIGENLSRLLAEESRYSIEIDIILGDIRALYQDVRNLHESRISATTDSQAVSEKSGSPAQDTIVADPVPAQAETPAESPVGSPVESKDESKADDHVATREKNLPPETPPSAVSNGIKEASGKPVPGQKAGEPSILADKYTTGAKFINESLAGKKQDISSKIQSTPISNIGSALGVNDRFKLINDLFNGDKDSFQKTIDILNGAANFNEAFNYITSSFDWDMEEDSVQLLLELVRRKFIVNQNE